MAAFTSTFTTTVSTPQINSFFSLSHRNREFRIWRRHRLKLKPKSKPKLFSLKNDLNSSPSPSPLSSSSISSPFDFLSLLPVNWLPPAALGFLTATLALSLSSKNPNPRISNSNSKSNSKVLDIGEWILFTSPTPFNRFVLLRCPSVSFEGGEFLEDVNDKLVKEDKHYVRLDNGRIEVNGIDEERENGDGKNEVEYQRECVRTEDGGVISLDWPANLDLNQEHGLDTTVLIVPGTSEGSLDKNVKGFVCECLRRGLFPVVMNPRGCAGSPLTTARLFTAADSDDISSAIQLITRARPWSTLTGVGWGYGANMLTKYLAEAGEKTPLTAATCIDNPFDLDEVTRTTPYSSNIDKKLTGGLIEIVKSNKELFQGKRKGFDVENALSAKSVRDFEKAISMVSYGFDTIEEFYSSSSTRSLVGKLKIPVLFVQNDDGTVPLFSIPRGLIAENPFTSLLLCSYLPSDVTAISWYQQVTIEWLTAVELGLLKGRHPLLQDTDVTINPSKGLSLVEGRTSDTNGRLDNVVNLAELDISNTYLDAEMLQGSDTDARINVNSNQVSQRKLNPDAQVLSESNGAFQHTNSVDADSAKDDGIEPVLQTAQVVMNMLDVTMPGTLKEEEKKKVLAAVAQGDTLIKALQDAVPEDVRGKLTTSVSEILQAQGKNLNFDALLSVDRIANVSSGLKSNIKQSGSKNSDIKKENSGSPSHSEVSGSDLGQGSGITEADMGKHVGEGTGSQSEENSVKSSDILESKSGNPHGDDTGLTKDPNESQNRDTLDNEFSTKKVGQVSELDEEGSETFSMMRSSSENAGATDSVEAGSGQNNRSQEDETKQLDVKDSNISAKVGNHQDLTKYQSITSSPSDTSEAPASPISEGQLSEKGGDEGKSKDEKLTSEAPASPTSEGQLSEKGGDEGKSKDEKLTSEAPASPTSEGQLSEKGGDGGKSKDEILVQPLPEQNRNSDTKSPTFNVSQALDALTGLDDSTQVAVNSVFGVIEDMLNQLEERKNESTTKKGNENNDATNGSVTEKTSSGREIQLEKQTEGDDLEGASAEDMESMRGWNSDSYKENEPATAAVGQKNNGKTNLVLNKLATNQLPLYRTTNPYAEVFYHECLRKYILSNIQKVKPFELDTTTALFLDYNPEEGSWLLPEQPGGNHGATSSNRINRMEHATPLKKENVVDNIIEPAYVILDSERHEEPSEELELNEKLNVNRDSNLDESKLSVKTIILNSLKVEVSRRLSVTDKEEMEGLAADMEEVANAVYLAIQHDKEHKQRILYSSSDYDAQEGSQLKGKHIIEAISLTVRNTSYLKRILPVGVIVGSTLAALRNFFDVAVVYDNTDARALNIDQDYINGLKPNSQLLKEAIQLPSDQINRYPVSEKNTEEDRSTISGSLVENDGEKVQPKTLNRDTLMVGAVTAALGASAFLTSQQEDFMGSDSNGISSSLTNTKHMKKEALNLEELVDEKHPSNIVTSLAEKAMSVAAPVVPTKEGGGVDQERLVAMLAELGQKGGVLKLVGKLALLWGGLRGAMSLTDRLISFLRIAERPLLQRVLGFFCMVLVLWSPVLVPLLPTLFHNWATHNSSRIAELACIFGLYTAVTILIMQWGKRIRGNEYPLKQYGLDFMSSRKIPDLLTGLVGGVVLVSCIHSVNVFLGFVNLSLPPSVSTSSLDLTAKVKAYGQLFLLAGQGIVTAAGVAFVEELLFRSWLLEEIAADVGYHPGIILSGLAFSLSQRSLLAIPGLWLLSMSLAGARLRLQGSLFVPIGMRTGIMASSYILHMGGFLIYQPKFHWWIAGTHPMQPFGGLVGLIFALVMAIFLYPRQPGLKKEFRTIQA